MKILFVVPYVPNLIRTRSYNLITQLAEQGHDLTVATLWTTEQDRRDAAQMESRGVTVRMAPLPKWRSLANSLQAVPAGLPLQSEYCWQPALLPLLEAEALRADVIHVEHLRGVKYALHLKRWLQRRGRAIPIVWDSVDCISLLFRLAAGHSRSLFGRWMTRFELPRTERYEGRLLWQLDEVLVTSPIDRQALLDMAGHGAKDARVTVLPNGVDVEYFAPNGSPREPATVVFSGKMSYHANITMALHLAHTIMPGVWARRPDVKLLVVGKDPPREVQALQTGRNVTVTGTVNDLRPYLHHATVAAVPLVYGAGSQFKVLEAMACATPVVATPQAVAPLHVRAGEDALVAGSAEAFAAEILKVIEDADQQRRLGAAGRRYVERYHAWSGIGRQLAAVYAAARSDHQRAPLPVAV
jgi:glycosyltransferase involved in cell wall biosynthesis